MSLFPDTYFGGYGFGGYWGGQPYAVPAAAPADTEAKPKPDNALERPIGVGGIGYAPGNDPAPPWNLSDGLLMRCYPAVQAVLKAIICPIIAASRSFEVRNEDGTNAPKSKQIGPRAGDGVTSDPVDKLKDSLEEYHRPQWPDILTMLEGIHWGWWLQEPIYERADTPLGPLTLAASYRDFLPWEVQPLRDSYGQFAGYKYLNGKGDDAARTRGPEYALHFTEGGHLDPIFGWGRSRNAMTDWWRVRQSHLNGDRLERKPTLISMLIEMMHGVSWKDENGNPITDEQYAQKMYNAMSSGGTFITKKCPFDKDTVSKNPALAEVAFARATAFNWGDTGPAQAAQLSRAAALDANIVRCYGRKERSLFAAERGGIGTSDAGTHKDSDELDGEQLHEAACRAFSRQVLNVELVTNRGPSMRDRIWVKAGKLSDDDKMFKRDLVKDRAKQPGSPLSQMMDDKELAESTGVPIDPDKPMLPPLTPNAPPANGNPAPNMAQGQQQQPGTNGNGRAKRLGLSGSNGRGIRPFVGSGCGANAAGGGGFQAGNQCAAGGAGTRRAYHGSSSRFEKFDPTKGHEEDKYGPGTYFTKDKAEAQGWATESADGHLYTVDVTHQNPFHIDRPLEVGTGERINEAASRLGKAGLAKGIEKDTDGYSVYQNLVRQNGNSKATANRILRVAGFDGMIDRNELVVFDASQVRVRSVKAIGKAKAST